MMKLDRTVDRSTVRANLNLSASTEADRDVAVFALLRSPIWRDMNAVIIYCMRRVGFDSLFV
jgi:hypothetical protein